MGYEPHKMNTDFCDLCGLPLTSGTFTLDTSQKIFRFCCMGCRQVFNMLWEASDSHGVESFKNSDLFKKCREIGIIPSDKSDAESDPKLNSSLSPVQESVTGKEKKTGAPTLDLRLKVRNMWCPSCSWVIEEVLKKNDGVLDAKCNFSTDRFKCRYNPILTSPREIIHSIESLGYKTTIPGDRLEHGEGKREFIPFVVTVFLTLNVMMLSFALYSGFFIDLSHETIYKLSWPMFFMASVVLFYGGRGIYRKAWSGISSASFGMEALITIGSFSAYLYSTYNLLSGGIHLYYDTACMLIALVLLGKILERRTKGEVQEGLESFFSLRPSKVRICSQLYPDGRYAKAEQLKAGDVFRVEEGEIIPADGMIIEGEGAVDESSLTGEAMPVDKKRGVHLISGAKVIKGTMKIRAERVQEESTLGQMIQIMEKALEEKTPLEGKTDFVLQWFVPIVLFLAVGTGLVSWSFGLSFDGAIIRAVTVMVISCPCALGIAIPLARVAGVSVAMKKGILVRDFSTFEKIEKLNTFVLDKTGTVTHGQWALRDIIPFEPFSKDQVLAIAVALEQNSDHYIALEIKKEAEKHSIKPEKPTNITIFENGIKGELGRDEVKIGSRSFISIEQEELEDILIEAVPDREQEYSQVYMSFKGKLCALFVFGDRIRESSPFVIEKLGNLGYRIALISGDGNKTTAAVSRKIGVDEVYGEKLPREKADFVKSLQQDGDCVAMVGDGINDTPALVQSDLGIAVYSGNHLGREASDITLMRADPIQILDFLALGKQVNRKINQNLAYAFLYNIISLPIAMSGLLNPLIAVSAMLLSSLSVTGNTLLLIRKFRVSSSL